MSKSASITLVFAVAALTATFTGCSGQEPATIPHVSLEEVARSERQWTGVAADSSGRIFVCYPRWSPNVPFSVGELVGPDSVEPYPNLEINTWDSTLSPSDRFVCIQSVWVDAENYLWVLDPANPFFAGVVPGGAKLVKIDLAADSAVQVIYFDSTITPANSYLNDVRIDTDRQVAYITDSGAGALIVVDLLTGQSRRLLDDDPATHAEPIEVRINNRVWRRPDGSTPEVHADGIALDTARQLLYWHALTGRNLYRIGTQWLLDNSLSPDLISDHIEIVASTEPVDGILCAPDGSIYLSSLQDHAVKRFIPGEGVRTVVQDNDLRWPDSFTRDDSGWVYVTTSQIHLMPDPDQPFKLFRFRR
jgi:sugar lactone lactonase YvrE